MEFLMTVFAGGATGILGSFFSKIFGFVERWQTQKFRREEWQHEYKLLELQQKASLLMAEQEFAVADLDAQTVLRQASYAHDMSLGQASLWVVNVLRLVRPVLTVLVWIGVCLLWFGIGSDEFLLRERVVEAVIYAAVSALMWWFGDRAMKVERR